MGEDNKLTTPHAVYEALGIGDVTCYSHYCVLFSSHIPKADIEEIWVAKNKAWILDKDLFKAKVEQLMNRQTRPKPRGGDRRSKSFKMKDDFT